MLADRLDERADEEFPALCPVLVADQGEAEQVVTWARADIARLALELRVLRRDLTMAEAAVDRRTDGADLPDGARDVLAGALEQRVSRRRSELAVDAERVRAEAARLVTAAQAEAAAVVAAARKEMVSALLDGSDPRLLDPPVFRVVRDALPPAVPSPPAAPRPPVPSPPAAPRPPVASAPAPLQAPVPAPSPAEQPEAGRTIDASPPPPIPPPPAPPSPAPDAPPVSFWARYLYVDVLLPLVAVLIVVVVLLAWVG